MTAPEITAALRELIANTPPPVTVWGVRCLEPMDGTYDDGETTFDFPAGHIVWHDSEDEARDWLTDAHDDGYSVELVRVAGRVHVEG